MKVRRTIRVLLILTILTLNVSCDQISKNLVRDRIDTNEYVSVIQSYFMLTRVENTGAFLSAGNTMPQPFRLIVLTILPLIVMVMVFIYIVRKKSLSYGFIVGICFIVGGGIGNIYDRIVHGSVTDFMHIDLGIVRTGIFNMADVSIVIGGIAVLIASYLNDRRLKQNEEIQ